MRSQIDHATPLPTSLKNLKNIPSLRNDAIYRNQIAKRIIHNTEMYRLIKQGCKNVTKWVDNHPLNLRNQSYRLKEFERMQKAYKKPYEHLQHLNILEELAAIMLKPIQLKSNFLTNSIPYLLRA